MSKFKYEGKDLESMSFAKNYHSRIIKVFRPYFGSRIVEVGAGSGSVSEILLEYYQPKELRLVEPSEAMHSRLEHTASDLGKEHKSSITVYHDFFENVQAEIKKTKPDTFIYVNVFEHIEHDVAEMKRVYDTLEPGGHLCIFVPALQSLYSDLDKRIDHFRRYSRPELKSKVQEAGFDVVVANYFDFVGIFPWWLNFKVMKKTVVSPGAVKLYDSVAVPVLGAIENAVPPIIGKNVLLIARKPAK